MPTQRKDYWPSIRKQLTGKSSLPCTPKRRCPIMREALDLGGKRQSGLDSVILFALKGKMGATPRAGLVYRKHVRDGGVLVNFCPFCGGEVSK